MATASTSAETSESATQHIDVDLQEDVPASGPSGAMDEDMNGNATPTAQEAQSPQSAYSVDPQESSDPVSPFYQNSSKQHQDGSATANAASAAAHDQDDDMTDPILQGVSNATSAVRKYFGARLALR